MASADDTDHGNAIRLVAAGAARIRHEYATNRWFAWDGAVWREDGAAVGELARQTALERLAEVQSDPMRTGARSEAWAHGSLSAPRLKAAVELARSDPRIAVSAERFDADPDVLNTRNGVVNLRTGALTAHDPALLLGSIANASFDPSAECPLWEASLLRAMGGDAELVSYLQRAFGYAATGHTFEQVFFLFTGFGGTGKSTVLETLGEVLGTYAMAASASAFMHTGGPRSGPEPELHRLIPARYVYSSEIEATGRLNEARLRSVTGSEKVPTRDLWEQVKERMPRFSLFLASNTEPRVVEHHDGTWRRIHLVRWDQPVGAARELDFKSRLLAEKDGILAWVVRGAVQWFRRGGLEPPTQVSDWVASYRHSEDTLGRFLGERTVDDVACRVESTELYRAYSAWLSAEGLPPVSQREFGSAMHANRSRVRGSNGRVMYTGLRLDRPGEAASNRG